MSDEWPVESGESDIRRRAAWALGMLALVAALFVALMVTFLGTSGGDNKTQGNGAAIDGPSTTPTPSSGQKSSTSGAKSATKSASKSSSTSASSSPGHHKPASCPTASPCVVEDDIGDAVAAINAYRKDHSLPAVQGSVSPAAQKCALTNGSDCSGGWAESQVPGPDGDAAVVKIQKLGHLLDPSIKSIEVGWAYDPRNHQYFFAVVRNT
jgi:hypothetical protein